MNDYLSEMITIHKDIITTLDILGYKTNEDDNFTVTTNAPRTVLEMMIDDYSVIKFVGAGLYSYNIVFED
jgi:hypothetical protein